MDTIISKKKWTTKKIILIICISLVTVLILATYILSIGKRKINVKIDRVVISEVKKGAFQEFIPVTGIISPITTIYLDAAEGGTVEEKYIEDGTFIKKGQPILRLSNTDLELSLVNQETSVFNLLTQMQISRNNASQNTIGKLNQMAEVENAWLEAERLYKLNKKLFELKTIGLQEFKQSQIAYDYQVKRKRLTEQILKQDTISRNQESDQTRQSYERTQNALAVMRKKVQDLIVKAPVTGQITSLDAEIGQAKNKGMRLGQIDVVSGFKIRADIDEHYISRVFPDLKGEFNILNSNYQLKIRKVFTQVVNGRFQVDMEFVGNVPKGIRRGQTLLIKLALSDEIEAILIPRGGFYQATGGNWAFVITTDGKKAYRTDIKLGRQNPNYYEVLNGLKPGDKVITSNYESYGNIQELILKN